jgi:hypothetical protein
MVTSAPLIITGETVAELAALRAKAAREPYDVRPLLNMRPKSRLAKAHDKRMEGLTIKIDGPFVFWVTYSIETGHPCGAVRHMSMSIDRNERVPSIEAVWIIAEVLGFVGSIAECQVWPEELVNKTAVNIAQPMVTVSEGGHV